MCDNSQDPRPDQDGLQRRVSVPRPLRLLPLPVQVDPRPRHLGHRHLVILRLCRPPVPLHRPVRGGEGYSARLLSHLRNILRGG